MHPWDGWSSRLYTGDLEDVDVLGVVEAAVALPVEQGTGAGLGEGPAHQRVAVPGQLAAALQCELNCSTGRKRRRGRVTDGTARSVVALVVVFRILSRHV